MSAMAFDSASTNLWKPVVVLACDSDTVGESSFFVLVGIAGAGAGAEGVAEGDASPPRLCKRASRSLDRRTSERSSSLEAFFLQTGQWILLLLPLVSS